MKSRRLCDFLRSQAGRMTTSSVYFRWTDFENANRVGSSGDRRNIAAFATVIILLTRLYLLPCLVASSLASGH